MGSRGAIHHVELWVSDIEAADTSLGWLLRALGYELTNNWPNGRSWSLEDAYVVVESGPDVRAGAHDRLRPGLNHLGFHAGSENEVDELTDEALRHGWRLLFADRHPYAGGPAHYAAYLENDEGFEVELVASRASRTSVQEADQAGFSRAGRDSSATAEASAHRD